MDDENKRYILSLIKGIEEYVHQAYTRIDTLGGIEFEDFDVDAAFGNIEGACHDIRRELRDR